MGQLNPPPNRVEKFVYIWKEWFSRLYSFIQDHTGGSSTGAAPGGTYWNTHGNTADSGSATGELKIDASTNGGTFIISGSTGPVPSELGSAGTYFSFIPASAALRAGTVSGTQWGTIGSGSIALGSNTQATNLSTVAIGASSKSTGIAATSFGINCTSSGVTSTAVGATSVANNDGNVAVGKTITAGSGTLATAIGNNSTASGSNSSLLGSYSTANGNSATALGWGNNATGNYSIATGYFVDALKDFAVAIGSESIANGSHSIAFGVDVEVTGAYAGVIGSGVDISNKLTNPDNNKIFLGMKSTEPTLILDGKAGGVGTTGYIGIVEKDPQSTLDVGGSVGYKSRYINSGSGTTLTDELVVIVDVATPYTITLPQISTVPRRMYHIRRAKGAGKVTIQPHGTDSFDESGAGVHDNGDTLAAGASIQIVADTDPTTDTWWII